VTARINDDVTVGAAVALDANRAQVARAANADDCHSSRRAPAVRDLLLQDRVGVAQHSRRSQLILAADDADREAVGPGTAWRHTSFSGSPELSTT